MKILINAYACSPGMGSEPGMAWNWCVNLARYCELHIITEGEFSDKIEQVVPTLPQGGNMHFYYNPVSDKVRRMCWNQGDWRFYKYYRRWQWKTYLMAREICNWEHIDILHQLNMIGFREPGYLWKLSEEKDIPFVWGPVDAKDKFPVAYLKGATFKAKMFMRLKNMISTWQLQNEPRVKKASKQASVVFAASSNSLRSFEKYLHKDAMLMNETGCTIDNTIEHDWSDKSTFDLLWVGKMDFRKQLGIAIRAIAKCKKSAIRLQIVGGGNASEYKLLAEKVGISQQCLWYGAVSHPDVQQLMSKSEALLFTSVAEGTPHVVLEAIANGLPVVCFDTCGQGDVVSEKCGMKIQLSNTQQSVSDFAEKINYLYHHRDVLLRLSEGCKAVAESLSWDNKAKQMVACYDSILGSK